MNSDEACPVDHSAADEALDSVAVRRAAMDLLARREHAKSELRQKLQRRFAKPNFAKGFGAEGVPEGIDSVLDILELEGLQSDERYAQSYARQRIQRGWGPQQVRRDMRGKGLDEQAIAAAFSALDIDWCAQAREVYLKKFGPTPPRDMRDKARRLRFMQYRGFGSDEMQHLLESEVGDC